MNILFTTSFFDRLMLKWLATLLILCYSFNAFAKTKTVNYGGINYQIDESFNGIAKPLNYDGTTTDVIIPLEISVDGHYYTVNSFDDLELFSNQQAIKSVVIKNKNFMSNFNGCTNLVSVTLPEGTTELKISLKDCPNLDLAHLLEGIEEITTGDLSMSEPTDCGTFNDIPLPICYNEKFANRQYSTAICNKQQHEILDIRGTKYLTIGNATMIYSFPDCTSLIDLTINDCEQISLYSDISSNLETITLNNCNEVVLESMPTVKNIYLKGTLNTVTLGLMGVNNLDLSELTHLSELSIIKLPIVSLDLNDCVEKLSCNANNLTSLTGCSNVKEAYIINTKLKSLALPNIETVYNGAFAYNSELTELYLGKTLKTLGIKETLSGCPKFQDFIYGGSIEEWMKVDIDNFDETSPGNVLLAKASNFYYGHGNMKHTKLTELNTQLVGQATEIPFGAFTSYKGLKKISLPTSVKKIGAYAFENCTNLADVDIRAEYISQLAFYRCNIEHITLGNQITYIGPAFDAKYDPALTVNYLGTPRQWMKVTRSLKFYEDVKDPENQNGGLSIRGICDLQLAATTFLFNSKPLETITYEPGDEVNNAFQGIRSLKNIIFFCGEAAPIIPQYCFSKCYDLVSVKYGDRADISKRNHVAYDNNGFEIGRGAFENCHNLTEIEILDNIKSIGPDALYDTAWFKNQPHEQVMYFDTEEGKIAYTYVGVAPQGTHLNIEEGTVALNDDFLNIRSETSSEPRNFKGITSISLPSTLKKIGEYAIEGATLQGSFTIPASVEICNGSDLFGNLETLKIDDASTPLTISDYDGHQYRCCYINSNTLNQIYFGRNLRGVGFQVNNDSKQIQVTYGPEVTEVNGCNDINTNVCDIYSRAINPPTAISSEIFDLSLWEYVKVYNAFRSIDYNTCRLHIPEGSLDAYKSAEGWCNFINIIEDVSGGIDEINESAEGFHKPGARHFNTLGHEIDETLPGLHIVVNPDGTILKTIIR